MCGRFSQLPSQSPFQAPRPELDEAFARLPLRYNLAPGQTAGVLIQDKDEIALRILQWGLLPFWAKELSLAHHTINARIESVSEKPSFRAAFITNGKPHQTANSRIIFNQKNSPPHSG
jgi:putative SOS response-associated peptidase YedK